MNTLYYGDNLDILRNREYFPNESVDLIYLDPPFNSKKAYSIFFKDKEGKYPTSQIKAFDDTWEWCDETESKIFSNFSDFSLDIKDKKIMIKTGKINSCQFPGELSD